MSGAAPARFPPAPDPKPSSAAPLGGKRGGTQPHLLVRARPLAPGQASAPLPAQDEVLTAVQAGTPPGPAWAVPPQRFLDELLAEATEEFFAHPLAQERIGYVGFADRPDWTRIGLNEREDLRGLARRVDVPVLVVAHADDAAFGPAAQERETMPLLPGAVLHTIEGSRYLVPLGAPERLAPVMNMWAETLPYPGLSTT